MTTAITRAANVPATPIRPVPEALTTTNTAPAGTDVPIRPTPTRPTTDATAPATTAPEAPHRGDRSDRGRPRRHHVQQSLHHLERAVRHAVKDKLHESDAAGPKSVAAYRDLLHDFRDGLREAFHAAGKGREFDHESLLAGVGDAMAGLHTGLQALHDLVEENQPVPDPTTPYALQDVPQPGGLVSSEG